MTREQQAREEMRVWIVSHRRNPLVRKWIVNHPPPVDWTGTMMEYAYLEMPNTETWVGRLMLRLGM